MTANLSAAAQVQDDPGPVVLTLAANPVTGRGTIVSNAASEHDWLLLADLLAVAGRQVQAQLMAAAEARGMEQARSAEGSRGHDRALA